MNIYLKLQKKNISLRQNHADFTIFFWSRLTITVFMKRLPRMFKSEIFSLAFIQRSLLRFSYIIIILTFDVRKYELYLKMGNRTHYPKLIQLMILIFVPSSWNTSNYLEIYEKNLMYNENERRDSLLFLDLNYTFHIPILRPSKLNN